MSLEDQSKTLSTREKWPSFVLDWMCMKRSMDNLSQSWKIRLLWHYWSLVLTDIKEKATCQNFLHYQKEIPTWLCRQNLIQAKRFCIVWQETLIHFTLILALQLSRDSLNQSFTVKFIIILGLATKGIITRVLVEALLDNDDTKLKSIHCRFAGHVFPGESFEISVWKENGTFPFSVKCK